MALGSPRSSRRSHPAGGKKRVEPVVQVVKKLPVRLRKLVEEAKLKLAEVFGASATVYERAVVDPEEPRAIPTTFVVARVRQDSASALALMDQLDQEWWLEQLPRSEGRVQITFEHGNG